MERVASVEVPRNLSVFEEVDCFIEKTDRAVPLEYRVNYSVVDGRRVSNVQSRLCRTGGVCTKDQLPQ